MMLTSLESLGSLKQGSSNLYFNLYLFNCTLCFYTRFALAMSLSMFVCPWYALLVVPVHVFCFFRMAMLFAPICRHLPLAVPRPSAFRYTRQQLVSLNVDVSPLSSEVCSYLEYLGIHLKSLCHRRKKCRKYRAGKRVAINRSRPIEVVCNSVRAACDSVSRSVIKTNLISICPLSAIVKGAKNLTLSLFNAQSVRQPEKRVSICDFICDADVDILFLTETWLSSSGDEARCIDLAPCGYDVKSFPRLTRGGGLAVVARKAIFQSLKFTSSFTFDHSSFELVMVTLSLSNRSTHFFCIYRPPPNSKNKLSVSLFIEQLPALLDFCNSLGGSVMILGDFNFHYDHPDNPYVSKILDLLHVYNLEQSVHVPTHKHGHILDWIVYRPDDNILLSSTVTSKLTSDHLAILCKLDLTIPEPTNEKRLRRNINSIDMQQFSLDIKLKLESVGNPSAEQFHCFLQSILDKHAPLSLEINRQNKFSPWYHEICAELQTAKRIRRKAERRWLSSKLTVHKEMYIEAKMQVTKIVQNAKSEYYSLKIAKCINCKQLFNVADKLLGRNIALPLPSNVSMECLPGLFSTFFHDKVAKIRGQLDSGMTPELPSPYGHDVAYEHTPFTSFDPVTTEHLLSILTKCAPKSCDLDPIPTSLLLECLDVILPSMTDIINDSLVTGVFPSFYKTALVKPLLKKSTLDPNDMKNYRPVSNLPFMSKILEKVVAYQLLRHLNTYNLFSGFQSAYRPGHSTETALLKVVNDLLSALDEGKFSILVLLDLSAAFDTIDHDILLHRLHHVFGIQGTALSWFRSYLTNRFQMVSIEGTFSDPVGLCYGVPQGSVLGPILFILYTQPLTHVILNHPVSHMLYADDTQVYKSCNANDLPLTILCIEKCVSDVRTWMLSNKLQMNEDKTEVLLITPKRVAKSEQLPVSMNINGTSVTFCPSLRNLGVTLDSTLSLHQHILNVCRGAFLELRRIHSIRGFLTTDAVKTLVCSLVLSRIDYCNSLLAGLPQCHLQKIQYVQNAAARLIFRAPKSDHVSPLLQKLHWLPISCRIEHKVSSLCYNSLSGVGPQYLSNLTQLYTSSRCLRSSSDTRILKVPVVKTKSYGQRSFAYQGPTIWNKLPLEIRHQDKIDGLKRALKTYLFRLQ